MSIPSFMDFLALKKIGENTYQTIEKPLRMGNALPIAYGGCVLGWTCQAAHLSLPPDSKHRIYSIQGNYLGPTASDRPVTFKVTTLRETRTFCTRLVIASQEVNGKDRACLSSIVDFYISSGNTMLEYSAQPLHKVTHHSKLIDVAQHLEEQVKEGIMTRGQADKHKTTFGPFREYLEGKLAPEGISFQNALGVNFGRQTDQDNREIYNKINYDWFRFKQSLSQTSTPQERIPLRSDPNQSTAIDASLLSFILDGAIAFIPLTFSHKFLNHAKNCSSLDFSLRFHVDDIDAKSWFLRDMRTHAGSDERTYSEANCWQEGKDGSLRLVATMTQASILRGPEQDVSSKL